jgi:hypothetical protein
MIEGPGLTDRGTINLWSNLDPIDFELTHQSQQSGVTPVILPNLSDHKRPRINLILISRRPEPSTSKRNHSPPVPPDKVHDDKVYCQSDSK